MDASDPRVQRILATVDSIPPGRVSTYGAIAKEAHLAGRARLVGKVLGCLDAGSPLPWHRVLSSTGRISSRPGQGPIQQAARLKEEGVQVRSGRVNLQDYGHSWENRD